MITIIITISAAPLDNPSSPVKIQRRNTCDAVSDLLRFYPGLLIGL